MKDIKNFLVNESKSEFGPVFDILSKTFDQLGKEQVIQILLNDIQFNNEYINIVKTLKGKTDKEAKEEIYYNLPAHFIDVLTK